MAGVYHRLPLQWQGHHPGARKMLRPQTARSVNVGSREDDSELPTTTMRIDGR